MTRPQDAVRAFFRDTLAEDRLGNLAPLPGIFPDYSAPIVRQGEAGRELVMARWGMPSPAFAIKGKKTDPGVTNIRNAGSPHWRRWLGPPNRCLVPFTSFSENESLADGSASAGLVRASAKTVRSRSSPGSGRDGPRCARSRRARPPTTSSGS